MVPLELFPVGKLAHKPDAQKEDNKCKDGHILSKKIVHVKLHTFKLPPVHDIAAVSVSHCDVEMVINEVPSLLSLCPKFGISKDMAPLYHGRPMMCDDVRLWSFLRIGKAHLGYLVAFP